LAVIGRTNPRCAGTPTGQTDHAMAGEAVLALPQAERSRMTLLDPHPRPLDDPAGCTDAELIAAVRAGDRAAYAELYERHEPAARRMARQLSPSPHDVDDLVAEAFARVFDMLSSGRGPDASFRAYLLTAVRNGMYERARRDRRLELSDDMGRHDRGVPWVDTVEAELDTAFAVQAFASLPERWRAVLWYSEVEQESTAEVGSRLGLRPNAVAALAYRAREGLRQAFLQAHVTGCDDDGCRYAVARLGSWTRERLASGDAAKVDAHLSSCRRCRQVAAELAEVNSGLRGLLAPLLVGGAASGWLASLVRDSAGTASTAASSAGAAGAAASIGGGSAGAAGPALSAGTLSAGAASAGAAGAAGASGSVGGAASVAGGSVLGWLAGAHAGPAAAVLTAVVVGGTAVAAGVAVPHVLHRSPAHATGAAVPGTVEADQLAPATPGGAAESATKHPAAPASKRSAAEAKAGKKAGTAPRSANAASNASTRGQTDRGSANGQSGSAKNPEADGQGNGQTGPPKSPRASVPGNGQSSSPQGAQSGQQANGQSNPPKATKTARTAAAGAARPDAVTQAKGGAPGPASVSASKPARSVRVASAAAGTRSGTAAAVGGSKAAVAAAGSRSGTAGAAGGSKAAVATDGQD